MKSRLGVTPDPYSVYNPPDYYNQMITDPTQIPYQVYPYGGGGGGGSNPYGPYVGWQMGTRNMTMEDAKRQARIRYNTMLRRSETSDDPSHKYITAEGILDPKTAAALRAVQIAKLKVENPLKKMQKRIMFTVLLGSIMSALLK